MAMVINTNVASLTAQRNLNSSQSALSTSLQRLSSGLRINSAKDDAAGLAISERFSTQIRGLTQASRNASDGISLAQTAEGALGELGNNLQRIRELAVQAANSTNSASDRAALDQEVQQRLAEINRIATQTSFNGQKILDGTFGEAAFQIGANAGETINIGLSTSMKGNDVGQIATLESGSLSSLFPGGLKLADGDLTIQVGSDTAVNVAAGSYDSATELADAINTALNDASYTDIVATANATTGEIRFTNSGTDAVTLGGTNNPLGITAIPAATTGAITPTEATSTGVDTALTGGGGGPVTLASGNLTIGSTNITGTFTSATELANLINNANITGITATATVDGDEIVLANATNAAVTIGGTNNVLGITTVNAGTAGGITDGTATTTGVKAAVSAESSPLTLAEGDFTVKIGDGTAVDLKGEYKDGAALAAAINASVTGAYASYDTTTKKLSISSIEEVTVGGDLALGTDEGEFGFAEANAKVENGTLQDAKVTSIADANATILRIDAALKSVSELRSTLGAVQNRFESTISNLQATTENMTSSRSRILDADFASETASLTRAQILQQAGTAMLAQANSLPNNVLSLLRG